MMNYPIGKKGKPWQAEEKQQWFAAQTVKRSYRQEVVNKIEQLAQQHQDSLTLEQYGALSISPEKYPLYIFKSKNWQANLPTFLVTGGVHGYETSGVKGALLFVEKHLAAYQNEFNFVVAPCISPWGFETINRWNPLAIDPNRSFYPDSPSEEAANLMKYMKQNNLTPLVHIDLHETTDTDNSEFRPALAARDAIEQKSWNIPDGFYGVGDSQNPQPEFQKAIIESVSKVTHIAKADENGELIGAPMSQFGVINYDKKKLFLCGGFTDAKYVSTTEVYPDSTNASDEICNLAQVAAIIGAINYVQQAK
ncbi:MAG: M14 family metallocarboxypeptidase [Gammaproteobacteria bacterium]|nr:M14 family metallocarboxypeptidase [Gammaproteobacteria bacterium]